MNVCICAAVTLVIVCLVLTCLIVGLPFWLQWANRSFSGLWDVCIGLTDHEAVCRWFSDAGYTVDPYIEATRAMVCIALILVTIATVLACVVCCCKPKNDVCRLVAAVFCIVSAVCLVVAMIVYGVMYDDAVALPLSYLGSAYWLMLPTILLLLVAAVCFFLAKPVKKEDGFLLTLDNSCRC